MSYCSNCGLQIQEGIAYCPRCGAHTQGSAYDPLSAIETYKWIILTAGILIMVAAVFSLIFGLITFLDWGRQVYYVHTANFNLMIVGILNLIGFLLGFLGFLYIFERKDFKFVFYSTVFLVISGGFNFILLNNILILILALVGFIFLIISKDNYDVKDKDKKRMDELKQKRAFKPEPTTGYRIRELKGLLDDGVITVEEFEVKKKKLLKEL